MPKLEIFCSILLANCGNLWHLSLYIRKFTSQNLLILAIVDVCHSKLVNCGNLWLVIRLCQSWQSLKLSVCGVLLNQLSKTCNFWHYFTCIWNCHFWQPLTCILKLWQVVTKFNLLYKFTIVFRIWEWKWKKTIMRVHADKSFYPYS